MRSVTRTNVLGHKRYGVEITGTAHNNLVFRSYIGAEILGITALATPAGCRRRLREPGRVAAPPTGRRT